ncbi:MAG: hypothetical protein GEU90_03760 [Gemmatimonas sp.]|nr:hypothetical protein [Gemmatimonas sp.]
MSDETSTTDQPALWRRWPILAGAAIAPVMLALGLIEELAKGLVVAAVIYIIWGRSATGPAMRAGISRSSPDWSCSARSTSWPCP